MSISGWLRRTWHSWKRTSVAIALVCATASVAAAGARADAAVACGNPGETPYSMQLRALTGPRGADLTIAVSVSEASQCVLPDALKKVQLKTFRADGSLA